MSWQYGVTNIVMMPTGYIINSMKKRVLFLDLDEMEEVEARRWFEKEYRKWGACALFESSPGNYHFIAFDLLDFKKWISMLKKYAKVVDPLFRAYAYKNKYSNLRISPKWIGEVQVKPAPRLLDWNVNKEKVNKIQTFGSLWDKMVASIDKKAPDLPGNYPILVTIYESKKS